MAKKPRPKSTTPNKPTDPIHSTAPAVGNGSGESREIIRSEEQLLIGTQVRVSGRAVLRKYVVTETVTQTFQVRHEEVRLEHEPAGPDTDRSASEHPPFSDDGAVIEMVLHREVPRVQMEVLAVERVRLHTDTITTQLQITDGVRKEQLAFDPSAH